ncbi:c-type cytochrome [Variovorax sp. LjRoot84]|uniref:c-type cytochrome n=1 Tax=Variovorax sp. LjRoot84 TaxID=3342340 RepID=UPI003ECCFBBF
MRKSPIFKRAAAKLFLGPLLACGAHAADADVDTLAQQCMRCHGAAGISSDPRRPSIAGKGAKELYGALQAYRNGSRRGSNGMTAAAQALSATQMRSLAAYFSALPADEKR